MKVLFLDIDGVLNSVEFSQKQVRRSLLADTSQIDPVACSKINNLVKTVPDLKIVISSTWRLYPNSMKFLEEHHHQIEHQ